jgi:hypothetical protein
MWIASAERLDGSNVECIWLQRCWCQSAGDGDDRELLVAQKNASFDFASLVCSDLSSDGM